MATEGERIRAAMAASDGVVHYVFVECVCCNAREEIAGDWYTLRGRLSDKEAIRRFTEMGWHVEAGNVRCPNHRPADCGTPSGTAPGSED